MRAALLCSLLLLSAACGDASTLPLSQPPWTDALRLESAALTIWLSPQLTPDDRADATPFVLSGATDAAGELALALSGRVTAIPVEDGRFAVSLDDAQLGAALAGEPLVLRLEPPGQPVHTVSIRLSPRFLRVTGDAPLTLEPWVEPRDGRFEGEARAAERVAALMIQTDDDSDPEVERAAARRWRFAWSLPSLKLAAWPSTDPVYFYARDPQGALLGTTRAELGVVVRAASLSVAPR